MLSFRGRPPRFLHKYHIFLHSLIRQHPSSLLQCLQRRGQVQRQRAPVPAAAVVVVGPCHGGAGALPGGRVAGRRAVVGAERGGQVVQAERLGELRVEQGKPGNLRGFSKN